MRAVLGRPPLHMKLTNVRFPEETLNRIDVLVGANRRAQFIREVVERELERIEKSDTATEFGSIRR